MVKVKIQPVFGFMCTLEPLGYAPSQYFTIPFLVLQQCMNLFVGERDTEANRRVLKYVQDTCVQIMKENKTFRNNFIESVFKFINEP